MENFFSYIVLLWLENEACCAFNSFIRVILQFIIPLYYLVYASFLK